MDIADGSPRGAASSSEQQQQLSLQQQGGAAAAPAEPAPPRAPGGAPRLHVPLEGEVLPEAWCDEVAERLLWAIVTAASGDDAKAKAAALLREHAVQLAHAQHDEPSQAELAKEAESAWREVQTSGDAYVVVFPHWIFPALDIIKHSYLRLNVYGIHAGQELAKRVELLQNDKLLLARAVKAQHEKLQVCPLMVSALCHPAEGRASDTQRVPPLQRVHRRFIWPGPLQGRSPLVAH